MHIQGVEPGSVDMLATSVARAGQLAVHGRQCRGCSEPRYTDWFKGDERRIAGSQKTVVDGYTIVDNQLPAQIGVTHGDQCDVTTYVVTPTPARGHRASSNSLPSACSPSTIPE